VRQLLINISRNIVAHLGLEPGPMKVISTINDKIPLGRGAGPAKIVDVGRGKLRLYIPEDKAPFKEGERVLVTVRDDKLVVNRINYYIVKPTISTAQYRVNIPWELVKEAGLVKHSLVKIYRDGGKIVIEPLGDEP